MMPQVQGGGLQPSDHAENVAHPLSAEHGDNATQQFPVGLADEAVHTASSIPLEGRGKALDPCFQPLSEGDFRRLKPMPRNTLHRPKGDAEKRASLSWSPDSMAAHQSQVRERSPSFW